MKKWLSMLMAAVLLVTAAAALADDVITLRVWGGVPAEAGPQASIDLFNEAFKDKGIQAEYERFVNDDTGNLKLETSLLAGNDVDQRWNQTFPKQIRLRVRTKCVSL